MKTTLLWFAAFIMLSVLLTIAANADPYCTGGFNQPKVCIANEELHNQSVNQH